MTEKDASIVPEETIPPAPIMMVDGQVPLIYVIQLSYMLEILYVFLLICIFAVLHSSIWWVMEAALCTNMIFSIYQIYNLEEILNKKYFLKRKIRVMVIVNVMISIFWIL